MDDPDGETIANRDDTIPVLRIPSHASSGSADLSDADPLRLKPGSRRERMKEHASKIKDRLVDHASPYAPSIQERLFTGLMAQIIPPEDLSENEELSREEAMGKPKDRRSRQYVDRPNFSVGMMSGNFRRFNARIGIVFVFQNRLIRLFTWKHPTATLSFLAVYTLVCLDPELLPLIPLVATLFLVMLPSFLARHPAPENDLRLESRQFGPPVAPPSRVKPAPELSKDFFRNMRDLQNVMEDFSRGHDAILTFLTPLTNFSNENLSSLLYIILLLTSCALFLISHLLPWRLIFLVLGYAATAMGHPSIQELLDTPANAALLSSLEHDSRSSLLSASKADIELTTSQEAREVEIFELQHRPLHNSTGEYEPYLFSHSPYSPLSPARISGDRPRGAAFFEDVQPPRGWRWADKKWTLDLLSREWVEDRCVTGVEVEIEGERWVTDLHYEVLDEGGVRKHDRGKGRSSEVGEQEREVLRRAWESGRPSRKGEWRRRRWVRMVERVGASY